jgi:hypothetical protein
VGEGGGGWGFSPSPSLFSQSCWDGWGGRKLCWGHWPYNPTRVLLSPVSSLGGFVLHRALEQHRGRLEARKLLSTKPGKPQLVRGPSNSTWMNMGGCGHFQPIFHPFGGSCAPWVSPCQGHDKKSRYCKKNWQWRSVGKKEEGTVQKQGAGTTYPRRIASGCLGPHTR